MQLYLNTYGTYLHVKDQLFEVRIPGEQKGAYVKKHFAAPKISSIVMTTAGSLSTDAIALALQHHIDLLFADRSGFPIGRVWHSKLGSTTLIRKRQLEASLDQRAVHFVTEWVGRKLEEQAALIKRLEKHRKQQRDSLLDTHERILKLRQSIAVMADQPTIDGIAESIRGIEGTAGRLYFKAISAALPTAHQFTGRSNRPATDAFNAFLNYGYGILYARVEKALLLAGLDPFVGFLHRDDYNQKSMVFDFIEPYRPAVDWTVFRLFSGKLVRQDHTRTVTNGVSLDKPGKELLIERLNQYLEVDRVRYRGRQQSRMNAMQQDAHRFANQLIDKV